MAINPALLIAAPVLQDYLVDKSLGSPLSAGIVTCYEDSSRTTLKNWYYQTGTLDNYSYVALPNPMTLSAVGTIVDVNGNDTIPFFYPYSEDDNTTLQTYFITVYNSNGQFQFSRQNFPYVAQQSTVLETPTLKNYIVNNQFWRNIGSISLTTPSNTISINGSTFYYNTLAPSQHDGFSMPDFIFLKNITGATETVTFEQFALSDSQTLTGDITPEFYVNHTCSAGQAGETLKCYQFPISFHLRTLDNVQATFTIQAKNNSGNVNNELTLFIYQFSGTGVTSNAPIEKKTFEISDSWKKYTHTFTFPSSLDDPVSTVGDDSYYLQIGLPLGVTCDLNFTLPSIYLSTDVPTNNFTTYDEVDAIINSPRTGDYRFSLNSFQPFGWVGANDGSIGSPSSSATTRANVDTWQLYNLLWNSVLNTWSPVSGGRGSSSYADFTANKAITLTRNLGRVVAGINPVFSTPTTFTVNTTTDILTLATATNLTVGTPVQVYNTGGALPSPLGVNLFYFISVNSLTPTTVKLSTSIESAYAGIDVDITTTGTGVQTITNALGLYDGESAHPLSIAEMPSHDHPPSNGGSFVTNTNAAPSVLAGTVGSNQTVARTGMTGGGQPHNTIQPTVYVNAFFKL